MAQNTAARTHKVARVSIDMERYKRYQAQAAAYNMSFSDYINRALDRSYQLDLGEINSDSILVIRINQLIDAVNALAVQDANLEHVVTRGFSTFVSLTRGTSELLGE